MMPAIDPRDDARNRRGRVIGTVSAVTVVVAALLAATRFRDWATWLLGTEVIVVTAITVVTDRGRPGSVRGSNSRPRGGRKNSGSGGNSAISAHNQREAGPVAPASARRQLRLLITVSRMMPTPSGQRWLAEAESLLSEIAAARRGAAVRSYLRSAPRLTVMMWAHDLLRRAHPGPRRPG
jgi:hypothetical protein